MTDYPQNDFNPDTSLSPDGLQVQIDELRQRIDELEAFTGVATMNDLEAAIRVHRERDHIDQRENPPCSATPT